MAVIESDQWLTALRRYNSKTDSTPFRELIARMPGLHNYYDYFRLHLYMHGVNLLCTKFIVTASLCIYLLSAEAAEKVLDRCCKVDAFNSRMHKDFWVDFNFEFIEDLQDATTDQTGGSVY